MIKCVKFSKIFYDIRAAFDTFRHLTSPDDYPHSNVFNKNTKKNHYKSQSHELT